MAKEPSPEQLEALTQRPQDAPVVMVNLLCLEKGEGAGEYGQYAKKIAPIFQAIGARILYSGTCDSVVVGDVDEKFDAIALVEYPSIRSFLGMLNSDEYKAIHPHRDRGLESQWLLASTPATGPSPR
ncbi:DUF1330 domain-containing protein [Myxococcota bacterium]|nr:DUF1330 domain-containing protein [Myxococcota bacterium]